MSPKCCARVQHISGMFPQCPCNQAVPSAHFCFILAAYISLSLSFFFLPYLTSLLKADYPPLPLQNAWVPYSVMDANDLQPSLLYDPSYHGKPFRESLFRKKENKDVSPFLEFAVLITAQGLEKEKTLQLRNFLIIDY